MPSATEKVFLFFVTLYLPLFVDGARVEGLQKLRVIIIVTRHIVHVRGDVKRYELLLNVLDVDLGHRTSGSGAIAWVRDY